MSSYINETLKIQQSYFSKKYIYILYCFSLCWKLFHLSDISTLRRISRNMQDLIASRSLRGKMDRRLKEVSPVQSSRWGIVVCMET